MGREIKRVPVDFNWPMNKVWEGYLNLFWDFHVDCINCNGTGSSNVYRFVQGVWYQHMMYDTEDMMVCEIITDENLLTFAKEMLQYRNGWSRHLDEGDVKELLKSHRLHDLTKVGHTPTAKEVNEWAKSGFGHDAINRWICVTGRLKRYGYKQKDHSCKACKGKGYYFEDSKAKWYFDHWSDYDPPMGEGYQLWETVSEGSPVSPVFETKDKFIKYLIGQGHSEEAANSFVESEWAPSGIITDGKMYTNIDAQRSSLRRRRE